MFKRLLHVMPVIAVSGCASTQLTYNTIDIASNIDSLFTRQALVNLSKFIDDQYAIPSQLDIQAGTIQTSNAITPSVTFPLTDQVANTVTRAGAALMAINVGTSAGAGASLSGTNIQQQNWNVTPLTDANTLRNLQALYRYAVYGYTLNVNYIPSRVFVNNDFFSDPYQLQEPHCILCAKDYKIPDKNPRLYVNGKLHGKWLYWTTPGAPYRENMPADEPLVDLGHYGNHELYMTQRAFSEGYLTNFVFFILPNSEPVEVFAAGKENLATAAPSTNGRVTTGSGRHNFNVLVPQGIQP